MIDSIVYDLQQILQVVNYTWPKNSSKYVRPLALFLFSIPSSAYSFNEHLFCPFVSHDKNSFFSCHAYRIIICRSFKNEHSKHLCTKVLICSFRKFKNAGMVRADPITEFLDLANKISKEVTIENCPISLRLFYPTKNRNIGL